MSKSGTYIVIEGTDGAGKSTQADLLLKRLENLGHTVTKFHEPAGVPIANELRKIILDSNLDRSPLTNVLLFTAARREVWYQLALPALERGEYVIATRNYYSTLAYQAIAEELGPNNSRDEVIKYIERITLDTTDQRYMSPDVPIILDMDDKDELNRRIASRGDLETPDTFESREDEFQQRIIDGYRLIADRNNVPIISATQSPEDVAKDIWSLVESHI